MSLKHGKKGTNLNISNIVKAEYEGNVQDYHD